MPEPTPLILARREATQALGDVQALAGVIQAGRRGDPVLATLIAAVAIASELRALGFAIEQAVETSFS